MKDDKEDWSGQLTYVASYRSSATESASDVSSSHLFRFAYCTCARTTTFVEPCSIQTKKDLNKVVVRAVALLSARFMAARILQDQSQPVSKKVALLSARNRGGPGQRPPKSTTFELPKQESQHAVFIYL